LKQREKQSDWLRREKEEEEREERGSSKTDASTGIVKSSSAFVSAAAE
jgi:hypothetical protein